MFTVNLLCLNVYMEIQCESFVKTVYDHVISMDISIFILNRRLYCLLMENIKRLYTDSSLSCGTYIYF